MNFVLKNGDKVGIIACSNGLSIDKKSIVINLQKVLNNFGLNVVYASTLYKKYSIFNGNGEERANELNNLFRDKDIKAIFDISGGDVANGMLDYIDYDVIKNNPKPFFGYSDLSVVLNAIYGITGVSTCHYQLRNLIGEYKEIQLKEFKNTFIEGKKDILDFNYEFIQGNYLDGEVIGGNLRCFLKLAGTKYMPSFKDKILFLEAMSGDVGKVYTFINQYKHLGVFESIKGIILGTFTEMESKKEKPSVEELLLDILKDSKIPIVKTKELGHGQNSKCIIIGEKIILG